MSKTGKASSASEGKTAEVPFEEALKRLESIVETMEEGELPLEGLLTRFEEGKRLVQLCQAKLAQAEVRIQQLEKSDSGELVVRPMTPPENRSESPSL